MPRRQIILVGLFLLLLGGLFSSLLYLSQKKIWYQKAQQVDCQINIEGKTIARLNRNWGYFAQGGEEKEMMLAPVSSLIGEIKPVMIRIDHVFDFPNFEQRINEIYQLGAKPFISLSYFPTQISSDPTKLPDSLDGWTNLITETALMVDRLSNNDLIYYEVWNEPDLFGKMNPEEYFRLYQSTLEGLARCKQCRYKIGGPAITTMKSDWMNGFLIKIADSKAKIDFVSWHSYQKNPERTVEEFIRLRDLEGFKRLSQPIELVISEWGIIPEISTLNDSYASASHAIAGIAATNELLQKLFAFEIKDGPDPEGKQFWGRWGMITHQNSQSVTKPKFEAFRMLNTLYDYRLLSTNQEGVYSLATTDGLVNYNFLITHNANYCRTIKLNLNPIPNGEYQQETFSLDAIHNPTIASTQTVSVGTNQLTIIMPILENGVYRLNFHRTNAALVYGPGRGGKEHDRSARIGQGNLNLDYPFMVGNQAQKASVGFWFKSMSTDGLAGNYQLAKLINYQNNGGLVVEFVFNPENEPVLVIKKIEPSGKSESTKINLKGIDLTQWHYYQFSFDDSKNTFGLLLDNYSSFSTYTFPWPVGTAGEVIIGPTDEQTEHVDGFIDSVMIKTNENNMIYLDEFNQ